MSRDTGPRPTGRPFRSLTHELNRLHGAWRVANFDALWQRSHSNATDVDRAGIAPQPTVNPHYPPCKRCHVPTSVFDLSEDVYEWQAPFTRLEDPPMRTRLCVPCLKELGARPGGMIYTRGVGGGDGSQRQ